MGPYDFRGMIAGRSRRSAFQWTSKTVLGILSVLAFGYSTAFWWGIQSTLIPDNKVVAAAFTAILVLAPPSLVSFLIPWSPAGMLLQKVNAKTWGYAVIIACSFYLLYYSFQIQYSYWAAQQVVAASGLIYQQVFIGMIGFTIIPALLWTPVSSEELQEQVRQAHLVKRYELQTQADIAILRSTLLRAQEKALIGFANLTVDEREELASVMRSLVGGIDRTLNEVGKTVKTVAGVTLPFDGMLDGNEDIRDVLDYIGESLTRSRLLTDGEEAAGDPVAQYKKSKLQYVIFKRSSVAKEQMADFIEMDENGDVIASHPQTGKRLTIPKSMVQYLEDEDGNKRRLTWDR